MTFDEVYYAKGAQDYIASRPDSNNVHPPLGKLLIAGGIRAFPQLSPGAGWRIASVCFGLLHILVIFALALTLTRNYRVALMSSALLSLDFLHIVQSRIAMLDIFLSFFSLSGFYFTALALKPGFSKAETSPPLTALTSGEPEATPQLPFPAPRYPAYTWFFLLASVCFGLACACKWNGIFAALAALSLFWSLSPEPLSLRHKAGYALYLLLIIALIYAVSFLPTMHNGKTLSAIYHDHLRMVHFRYQESFTHPYLSQPWSWPLVIRPIWYHFEQDAQKITRGIIAMGAPLFWWTFLIFLPQSLILAFKYRNRAMIFMLTAYFSQYLFGWLSKGGFFYYMLPCVPWMCLITAMGLEDWWQSKYTRILTLSFFALLGLFLALYLPLLTGYPVSNAYFRKLMWFKSWI